MAHSRSDLHRKAAQAAAIKRAKACRHMHTPLVASAAAVTVRNGGNQTAQTPGIRPAKGSAPSARRGGRIPGLVKPQPGAPDGPGRRRKVTAATAARLDRIVDGLVASFLASNGAAAVSKKVSFGAAPEAHDTPIRAYLLEKLSGASTRAQCRVEIERQGPLLSVRVTFEPAAITTALPTRSESAPHRPVTIPTSAGPFEYTPPIDLHRDTYSAQEASSRLSRTGQSSSRTIAHERRKESKLLALKVANGFRFPTFQFDPRGGIHPLVERANMRLGAFNDPWGTLSWWFEDNDILDDMSPVAALAAGTLDEQLLDAALDDLTAGM